MNKSDSIAGLAKALNAAQAEIQPAAKDSTNPHFKSKFASLNSIWDAARPTLTKHGLAIAQLNQRCEGGVVIETVLMHTSGEWISGELFVPLTKMDAQGVGSACSYARRYSLASMIGIVADEDDDGNHASGHNGTTQQRRQTSGRIATAADRPKAVEQPTEREGLMLALKEILNALNKSGDSIVWAPAKLAEYISEVIGEQATLETLDTDQLRWLVETDLKNRLIQLRNSEAIPMRRAS